MTTTKMFELKDVPTNTIIVSDRARKDIGDLAELKQSILANGLLQPILVTPDLKLIAGERRLTAFKELSLDTITVRIMPADSEDNYMIMEMMENVARKEFVWHELIELKYKLHKFWKAQTPEWAYKDTAEKLQCSIGLVSGELALAEALSAFPQLKEFQSKAKAREAYKRLCQRASDICSMNDMQPEEKARLDGLLQGDYDIEAFKAAGDTPASGDDKPQMLCAQHDDSTPDCSNTAGSQRETPAASTNDRVPKASYIIKPCLEVLSEMPDASVGMFELDPPYAIDYDTNYGKNLGADRAVDWSTDQLWDFYSQAFPILHAKLKDRSWVLIWTGKEHWVETLELAAEAGFGVQPPGVWAKPSGTTNTPSTTMVSMYETFLLLRKGQATFNKDSFPNVLQWDTVPSSQRTHQWEKPIGLYRYLISQLGRQDTIFFSCFAGSGNAMVAAALECMSPVGTDTSQEYIHGFYRKLKSYYITE